MKWHFKSFPSIGTKRDEQNNLSVFLILFGCVFFHMVFHSSSHRLPFQPASACLQLVGTGPGCYGWRATHLPGPRRHVRLPLFGWVSQRSTKTLCKMSKNVIKYGIYHTAIVKTCRCYFPKTRTKWSDRTKGPTCSPVLFWISEMMLQLIPCHFGPWYPMISVIKLSFWVKLFWCFFFFFFFENLKEILSQIVGAHPEPRLTLLVIDLSENHLVDQIATIWWVPSFKA